MMHQLIDPPRSIPQLIDPPIASLLVNRGKEEGEKLKLDWTLVARRVGTNLLTRSNGKGAEERKRKGGRGHKMETNKVQERLVRRVEGIK
jgi:hypothetical protein